MFATCSRVWTVGHAREFQGRARARGGLCRIVFQGKENKRIVSHEKARCSLPSAAHPAQRPDAGAVLTKAVVSAADRLAVKASVLGPVLGVSEATVSRMKRGGYRLDPGAKAFELGVLFVRLFRSARRHRRRRRGLRPRLAA